MPGGPATGTTLTGTPESLISPGSKGRHGHCSDLIGVDGFSHEPELQRLYLGIGIATGLAVINLIVGVTLVVVGKHHNALILLSNGKHLAR